MVVFVSFGSNIFPLQGIWIYAVKISIIPHLFVIMGIIQGKTV